MHVVSTHEVSHDISPLFLRTVNVETQLSTIKAFNFYHIVLGSKYEIKKISIKSYITTRGD